MSLETEFKKNTKLLEALYEKRNQINDEIAEKEKLLSSIKKIIDKKKKFEEEMSELENDLLNNKKKNIKKDDTISSENTLNESLRNESY